MCGALSPNGYGVFVLKSYIRKHFKTTHSAGHLILVSLPLHLMKLLISSWKNINYLVDKADILNDHAQKCRQGVSYGFRGPMDTCACARSDSRENIILSIKFVNVIVRRRK